MVSLPLFAGAFRVGGQRAIRAVANILKIGNIIVLNVYNGRDKYEYIL